VQCAHRPVSSAARLGEQVGAAQNARRKSVPSRASRIRFGVWTAYPYGDARRPVSWLCR